MVALTTIKTKFSRLFESTKTLRLASDFCTATQMLLMGLVTASDALYLPAMVGLALSGVLGIANSGQRLHRLYQAFDNTKNAEKRARIQRDIRRHWTKIVLVELPCLLVGTAGIALFFALGTAVISNVVLLATALLTIGAGVVAGWYLHKYLKEPADSHKKSLRLKKLLSTVAIFAGSIAGLALGIFVPQIFIAGAAVLLGTFVVMAAYFWYNVNRYKHSYHEVPSEEPSPRPESPIGEHPAESAEPPAQNWFTRVFSGGYRAIGQKESAQAPLADADAFTQTPPPSSSTRSASPADAERATQMPPPSSASPAATRSPALS